MPPTQKIAKSRIKIHFCPPPIPPNPSHNDEWKCILRNPLRNIAEAPRISAISPTRNKPAIIINHIIASLYASKEPPHIIYTTSGVNDSASIRRGRRARGAYFLRLRLYARITIGDDLAETQEQQRARKKREYNPREYLPGMHCISSSSWLGPISRHSNYARANTGYLRSMYTRVKIR